MLGEKRGKGTKENYIRYSKNVLCVCVCVCYELCWYINCLIFVLRKKMNLM